MLISSISVMLNDTILCEKKYFSEKRNRITIPLEKLLIPKDHRHLSDHPATTA